MQVNKYAQKATQHRVFGLLAATSGHSIQQRGERDNVGLHARLVHVHDDLQGALKLAVLRTGIHKAAVGVGVWRQASLLHPVHQHGGLLHIATAAARVQQGVVGVAVWRWAALEHKLQKPCCMLRAMLPGFV